MKLRRSLVTGTAVAAFALAAGQLHAQQNQQELSRQDVQNFFQSAEKTMTEAVQKGDFAKVLDWADSKIADEAKFSANMDLYTGDKRKGSASMTLDKDDVMALGNIFSGVMSGLSRDGIKDYSLQIEVKDVTPIGPDAATVRTEITERGALALPQMAATGMQGKPGEQKAGEQSAQKDDSQEPRAQATGQSAKFSAKFLANANCTQLVRRTKAGGDLVMGLANCDGRVDLNSDESSK